MLSRQQRIIAFVTLLSLTLSVTSVWAGRLQFWEGNTADNIAAMKAGTYNPYREFNEWLNDILFGALGLGWLADYVDQKMGGHLAAYYTMVYLRDLVAGTLVYWVTGGLWHLTVYGIFGKTLFDDKKRDYPDPALIRRQQFHAQTSVFVYAGLPALSEFLIESKLTKVYFYVDEIGGMHMYALFFFVYLACVEIGIYWMHRTLHTNKWLYNNIHGPHHSYKTREQLTPWASIAFHPIDGILQASPYVACLFFVPAHYFTHFVMLFFSGVWATNIHDAVPVNSEPIMGAKYHTMHHTHFVYNYGQFFTFCDAFWGTLRDPTNDSKTNKNKKNGAAAVPKVAATKAATGTTTTTAADAAAVVKGPRTRSRSTSKRTR